jgi:hypothetical protein
VWTASQHSPSPRFPVTSRVEAYKTLSWKACAYVKELRHGLSVTEKFVLLILAEYHRTDGKMNGHQLKLLLSIASVTERGVRR